MPRTFDRRIPELDKDPNRFGSDYANPLGAITDAAVEAGDQIRAGLIAAIKDATGIDLTGFANFVDWLDAQINLSLRDLGAQLKGIADTILNVFNNIVQEIKDATGLDLNVLAALNPTKILSDFQKFLDGVFALFGGTAGTGKTVQEVLAALGGWLNTIFKPLADLVQSILDVIAKIKPDNVAAGVAAGIDQVRDTIEWILGIGQAATISAAHANAGLDALMAGQKGGFFDEFIYPLAATLPATDWQKKSSLADNYGPDGSGSAEFKAVGNALGYVEYVQISKPLLVPDMKCSVTLSKLPSWDLLVKSNWRIKVQANATDQSCYQVEIGNTQCWFHSVSTTGAVTTLSGPHTIPANATGMPYTLEFKGTTLSLYRGSGAGILAASKTGLTPLAGRMVGFGAQKVAYVGGHPCINLAGISWQPAV